MLIECVFLMQCDSTAFFEFLAEQFNKAFRFSTSVFISKLRDSVTSATNVLLNSDNFRNPLKELCNKMIECSEGVLNFFIAKFISELSNKILMHAIQVMQNRAANVQDSGPRKRSKDNFSSVNFKRIVHCIGGSVVCDINRRQRNYHTATHIKTFACIMNQKFIEDKCCDPEIKEWTVAQDRGRLVHVSKNAFNFFIALFHVVMCHEEEDGSLFLEKVNVAVRHNLSITEKWDMLVGTNLDEEQSLEWLYCGHSV